MLGDCSTKLHTSSISEERRAQEKYGKAAGGRRSRCGRPSLRGNGGALSARTMYAIKYTPTRLNSSRCNSETDFAVKP